MLSKEEKELLRKDLCARLPYGLKAKVLNEDILRYDYSSKEGGFIKGIENMKVTIKHEKTDFGDVWHMSSVPKDIFRFAIYRYDDDKDTVYLSNVFVDNAHRKQGLGNSILNTADKIAKKLNAKIICLKVKQDSFVHEWYGRHGYSDLTIDEDVPQFIWMTKNIGE